MVGFAVASSAFTALIADQLTGQRGAASAAVGSAQAVGIVLGSAWSWCPGWGCSAVTCCWPG